jgi:hypothetical protein
MKRSSIFISIIILLIIAFSLIIYIIPNEKNPVTNIVEMIFEREYTIDIDRNFSTPDEEMALNISENLPYNVLLNTTRYSQGNEMGSSETDIYFIDGEVVEDGTSYVEDKKKSKDSGRFTFEYKSSCQLIHNFIFNQTPTGKEGVFEIEIDLPEIQRLDSYWAMDPPYTFYYDIAPLDPYYLRHRSIYDIGIINRTTEMDSISHSLEEVFFVQMLVEHGGSHKSLYGVLGKGYVTYQFVLLDLDYEPIFIYAESTEWMT